MFNSCVRADKRRTVCAQLHLDTEWKEGEEEKHFLSFLF